MKGSNLRPRASEPRALPTELIPVAVACPQAIHLVIIDWVTGHRRERLDDALGWEEDEEVVEHFIGAIRATACRRSTQDRNSGTGNCTRISGL